MQITCPECSARYLVKPESIGAEGRKVKCAKCSHIWKVEPPEQEPVTEEVEITPEPDTTEPESSEALNEELTAANAQAADKVPDTTGTTEESVSNNLPVPKEKTPAPGWLKAAAILLVCVALGMTFVAHAPSLREATLLSAIYGMFDMGATKEMRLGEVTVATMEKKGKIQFFVNGSIINTSTYEQSMPMLQVKLVDKNGEDVRTERFVKETTLPAGESMPFSTEISTRNKEVTRVVVDLGSGFDIGLR